MGGTSGWSQLFDGIRLWDLVGLAMVVFVLFVVVDTFSAFTAHQQREGNPNMVLTDAKMRMYITSTTMVGMLVWPVLWNALVARGGLGGGDRMAATPRLCLGFFWPLLMLLVDLQYARRRKKDPTFFEALQRIGYLKADSNTVITACFAIGTLLISLKKHDSAQGANLVMYALLLCVAFVMPTSDAPATSRLSIVIRASQKVCLNYAIGFVIAGIALDLVG